jgi:hypothetical protein
MINAEDLKILPTGITPVLSNSFTNDALDRFNQSQSQSGVVFMEE